MATTKVNTAGLDYATKKKVALNSELLSQRVQLSQVDVDHNGQISVNGIRMASEDGVQKQLYKILNLSPIFLKKFGKMTDETTKVNLINMIKSGLALSDVKKQNITVLGNPRTGLITSLLSGDKDYISHKIGFEIFERIMNTYPNFNINDFVIDTNGNYTIQLLTKDAITPSDSRGNLMLGESFNPGINFYKNFITGLETDFFASRLACDNGLIVQDRVHQVRMNQLTDENLEKYFTGLAGYEKDGFVPPMYAENIERGLHTNISFAELMEARSIILRNSALKSEEDLKQFLPEFSSEVHKLASRGVDYADCTDRQLENYPTNYKVWDVVNRLTDFGSHEYGFTANNESIQRQAGKLFNKGVYDSENVIIFKN